MKCQFEIKKCFGVFKMCQCFYLKCVWCDCLVLKWYFRLISADTNRKYQLTGDITVCICIYRLRKRRSYHGERRSRWFRGGVPLFRLRWSVRKEQPCLPDRQVLPDRRFLRYAPFFLKLHSLWLVKGKHVPGETGLPVGHWGRWLFWLFVYGRQQRHRW